MDDTIRFDDGGYEYVLGPSWAVRRLAGQRARGERRDGGALQQYELASGREVLRLLGTSTLRTGVLADLGRMLQARGIAHDGTDPMRALAEELDSIGSRILVVRRAIIRPVIAGSREAPPEPPVQAQPWQTWIEFRLVDDTGAPLAGKRFELTLPSGAVRSGSLDGDGRARIDGLSESGGVRLSFPELESEYADAAA